MPRRGSDLLFRDRVERIVYEAAGPYARAFERAIGVAGLPLAKVKPRQARRFAEAIGTRACAEETPGVKTDRVDAVMLARMGALLQPGVRAPARQTFEDLKDLHLARRAFVKNRTAAKNRQKHLCLPLLKRHNAQRLKQMEAQLAAIDAALKAVINQDAELARRFSILMSIPGLSVLTACAFLIDMPELGTLNGKQIASLAGLAPLTRQSGTRSGGAFIRGGGPNPR